jgi:hypothetical protein
MGSDTTELAARRSRYSTVSLAEARELTGLNLISSRDIRSEDGRTFFEMEEQSESKSHQSAKEHGVGYFVSIGWKVLPDGVGVRGTHTLADFLAIRTGRAVFVEVLSDANVKVETLQRKAQLQKHAELCFVLFSGTKRSNEANLLSAKRAVSSWADVLYCRLDGYGGNFIDQAYTATIAYDTTRERSIRVAVSLERLGKKVLVSVRFITHLYPCALNVPAYNPTPLRKHYEEIFLKLFGRLARQLGHRVMLTTGRPDITAFRAMRRSSGLRMVDSSGHVTARLRSEYRGPTVGDHHIWDDPFSTEFSPDDVYGVYVLANPGAGEVETLLQEIEAFGLTVELEANEVTRAFLLSRSQNLR